MNIKLQREKTNSKGLLIKLNVAENNARQLQEKLQILAPKLETVEHKYRKYLGYFFCY